MAGSASVRTSPPDASDGLLYGPLAGVYDLFFRRIARSRWRSAMADVPLTPDVRVLEVGVGTGATLTEYPPGCQVTGIDISEVMLAKARRKVEREGLHNIALVHGDAQRLPELFPAGHFDVVVAAFVLSVVPDPAAVLRGMEQVGADRCRFIIINHLRGRGRALRGMQRLVSPLARRLGWRTDLELLAPLEAAGLQVDRSWRVSRADLWQIVHASKRAAIR